ncbi:MAG: hypothetical protein LBV00_10645 [Propionibacteriaceae bacterium]|jgi:hypothetical protein|nr:hypothetical protein [Propionibacteriaceae bacterium]
MTLTFRNLTVTPADPVSQWGVEGLLTAIERGGAQDWGRIMHALDADTTGALRVEVECAITCADPDLGSTKLMGHYLSLCRTADGDLRS